MPPSSQQENYDSEPHSSRKRSAKDDTNDEDIDTELLDSLFISFVPPCNEDHLLIHGFGATDAFYKLQPSILTHKWKHSLEDYIHYALATNSILFLSPPIHVLTTFCRFSTSIIWKLPLPTNTVMEIIQVTQDLIANKITREMAVIKLFKMDLATNEYKFAKAVAKLARKLPRMSFAEESNEMELCSRHVDPFLSGLLDEGIFLRWNDFKIKKKQQNLLCWRPDICITKWQGMQWKSSIGFEGSKTRTSGFEWLYDLSRPFTHLVFLQKRAGYANDDGSHGLTGHW